MARLKTALRASESFFADFDPGVFFEPPVCGERREGRESNGDGGREERERNLRRVSHS
jgi:hypothetical protein